MKVFPKLALQDIVDRYPRLGEFPSDILESVSVRYRSEPEGKASFVGEVTRVDPDFVPDLVDFLDWFQDELTKIQ